MKYLKLFNRYKKNENIHQKDQDTNKSHTDEISFDEEYWDDEEQYMLGSDEPVGSTNHQNFDQGDRIKHHKFGNGTIVEATRRNKKGELIICKIKFDNPSPRVIYSPENGGVETQVRVRDLLLGAVRPKMTKIDEKTNESIETGDISNINFEDEYWDEEEKYMLGSDEPVGSTNYWNFEQGDRVNHRAFGNGIIIKTTRTNKKGLSACKIKFDNTQRRDEYPSPISIRELLLSVEKLTKIR